MKVIVEYINTRAQWKIVSMDEGTLPKQRYFDQKQEVHSALSGMYPGKNIVTEERDICKEQQHGLSLAKVLSSSHDGNKVFLQCHCGRKRIVDKEAMESKLTRDTN